MIRRLKSISISAVYLGISLLFVALSAPVDALTNEQQQAFDRGVTYFNTEIDRCGDELGPNQATSLGPKDPSGHSLPAAKGGTGFEEEIDASGRVKSKWGDPPSAGGYVTFAGNVRNASTDKNIKTKDADGKDVTVSMQDLYRNYYITMRWRYVLWNWDGSSAGGAKESTDFYSKAPRVLVTNPETGKSIIAVVLEAGPAPWTGVLSPPNGVDYSVYANAHKPPYWEGPVDGTPLGYRGRVSGFPPEAIKALGAHQRQSSGLNGEATGGDLVYSWATDQNALPGPTGASASVEMDNGVNTTACTASAGAGIVNADGYAFPVDPQKKRDYSNLPCPAEGAVPGYHAKGWVGNYTDRYGRTTNIRTCHHDHTPAFDLMYGGVEGKNSYAITEGTVVGMSTDYGGVQGCTEIQFQASQAKGGVFYWYGHQMNPKVSIGQHLKAGDPVSQVATQHGARDYGSDCYGGGPHLHIDRGCKNKNNVPQHGGNDECRDPAFLNDLQVIWNSLPEGS